MITQPQALGGVDRLDDREWQLCQQTLAGNSAACTELLQRYQPEIARQMWRFTRNRATQEVLVQEVLVEAYLSLRHYRRQGVPFLHWLRCIATRVGYRHWKHEARRRKHLSLEGVDTPSPQATDAPEAEAIQAAALLHDLLARLPAPDRLVLTLVYFEECSLKDIADRAGWNIAIVKMRVYRARNRLRKMIEDENLTERLMEVLHGNA